MSERTAVRHKVPEKAQKSAKKIPCLIVVEGSSAGEIFRIEKQSVLIGRTEGVDIVLVDEGVSRQHARIDRHETGFMITDLGSTNGTLVNGAPVEQTALREGDKILIGDVLLGFSFQDTIDVGYQENLRNMAIRDPLTNIYNRRYLLDALSREASYAVRLRQPLSCVMFDIDHFKKVNDTFGHPAGDTVLKSIAKALSEGLRAYDVFARYGGEEFVILLRGTAVDNALLFAERVRKKIETLAIDHEGKQIPVTVSIGVSALDPDRAQEPAALIKEADRYLYEAKRGGRNRVASSRSQT